MKFKDLLGEWNMTSLKIKLGFLESEWKPQDDDKNAAWELYVELITRIATQYLEPECGDEESALISIHEIFEITREVIKKYGRRAESFTKIAVVVLNQIVRPFTSKWHRIIVHGDLEKDGNSDNFRQELKVLQCNMRNYTRLLAHLADVEDLTDINDLNILN